MTNVYEHLISYKDIITLLIALIGFSLSIYNFILSLIANHVKLQITYKNHLCGKPDLSFMIIMMHIENMSRLPISVSRMFLNIGNTSYEFSSMKQFAYQRTRRSGDKTYDDIVTHTLELPQSIPALGIAGGFFHVVGDITNEQLLNEKTSITLWTTRGKRTYKILINNEVQHPN